ncbi:MAG: ParB/RepB/Spo0J family partition protein [Thermodesulfovibrionales bacterium]|nr:ParB/RepB/Spo0J family partition protein [Thermodesulfovibrionales bacterium]
MKAALGRGLDSLIPNRAEEITLIPINKIIPNENQPRKSFNDERLKELADSIKEKGIIQPVIVSRLQDGNYRLIAGERRWRAAGIAGLTNIPALIKDYSSQDAIEIALIENIQREDLNPIETAEAFHRLIKEYNLTQEELSKRVGKERATIANYIRVLKLPDEVKAYINNEELTIGHAKAILSIDDRQKQIKVAREIVKKGLSVRSAEVICKRISNPPQTKKRPEKMLEVQELEDKLKRALGTKVTIKHREKRGTIEIQYYSLDELDRLLEILLR